MIQARLFLVCGLLPALLAPDKSLPYRAQTERAEHFLQNAESGASNLQTVDRAYAYWLISQSLAKVNTRKEHSMLKKSCEAALLPQADGLDNTFRETIQLDCLRRMMVLDSKLAQELLSRADPNVRQQVFAAKAATFAAKDDVDSALTMLSSEVSQGARYPYQHALSVIKALPADDNSGRDRVFAQALMFYSQKRSRFDVGAEDLGTLVLRLHREITPGLVLQAIDELLDVAGEESAADSHLELTIKADSQGVTFDSLYQYRLFQLLPVIRELDSSRADQLIKDNARVGDALRKYTNGLQSLSPVYSDDTTNPDQSFSMAFHVSPGPAAGGNNSSIGILNLQIEKQMQEILARAKDDPEDAFRNAALIQDVPGSFGWSKADLLLRIAELAGKEHSRVAVDVLQEVSKLLEHYPLSAQCRYLVLIADQLLRLKEVDKAQSMVSKLLKYIDKLYAIDVNSDDPNRALKSTWPSTVVSRACAALAARISTKFAQEVLRELPDPDLRVFVDIELANIMLQAPSYPALVQERHKEEKSYKVSVFPIPSVTEPELK
jgi:negative regulator of replication initiation